VNSTTITCTTPARTTLGAVGVIVTTVLGVSNTFSSFTYRPDITSISPSSGSTLGGTSVTITGTSFTGASTVKFAGTLATNITVVNDTTITCITPSRGAVGPVGVIVTTGGVSSNNFTPFNYITPSPPVITSVSPSSGSTLGGTSVTVTGTSFTGTTSVTFGGTVATNIIVVNDTTVTCTTPAKTVGAVGIIVTTNIGVSNTFSPFTYIKPPLILVYTITPGFTLTLPISGGTISSVDWGNGTTNTLKTHTYVAAGTYTVTVSGTGITSFSYTSGTGANLLTQCTSFGEIGLTNLTRAFSGATNLTVAPSSLPTLSNVTYVFWCLKI